LCFDLASNTYSWQELKLNLHGQILIRSKPMKKRTTLVIGIAVGILCVIAPFVLASKSNSGSLDYSKMPQATSPLPDGPIRNESIPDYITYDQLFRLVRQIDEQAAKLAAEGVDNKIWSEYFQREAGLTKVEADALRQTANEFQSQIEPIDGQANDIIYKLRSAYPSGQIPSGVQVPPPPPELTQLQEQRNQIALNMRDVLNNRLGLTTADRFALFVQQNIANNLHVIESENPSFRARANQTIPNLR
jgi:hypothetical protein